MDFKAESFSGKTKPLSPCLPFLLALSYTNNRDQFDYYQPLIALGIYSLTVYQILCNHHYFTIQGLFKPNTHRFHPLLKLHVTRVNRKDPSVYKTRLWRLCPQARHNLSKPNQPLYSARVPAIELNPLLMQTFITYYSFCIRITSTCKGASALAQCSLQCEIWGFVLFSLTI